MLAHDYLVIQALADSARKAAAELLRHELESQLGGRCLAILSPLPYRVLAEPFRNNRQSWNLLINPGC